LTIGRFSLKKLVSYSVTFPWATLKALVNVMDAASNGKYALRCAIFENDSNLATCFCTVASVALVSSNSFNSKSAKPTAD
jgi:hypothetical protein